MELTTTRNLITMFLDEEIFKCGIERFNTAYPNISPDQEVKLLDILNNGVNTVKDVIWFLRATKQNSKLVSVEFATRCANRSINHVNTYYRAAHLYGIAEACSICAVFASIEVDDFISAIDAAGASVRSLTVFSDSDIEIARQKQDLVDLLRSESQVSELDWRIHQKKLYQSILK
jgi:hypothetical protein